MDGSIGDLPCKAIRNEIQLEQQSDNRREAAQQKERVAQKFLDPLQAGFSVPGVFIVAKADGIVK